MSTRVTAANIRDGCLIHEAAFQGACVAVDKGTALLRDLTGEIVLTSVPNDIFMSGKRYSIGFNSFCVVINAKIPLIELAGALEVNLLQNQQPNPQEVPDVKSLSVLEEHSKQEQLLLRVCFAKGIQIPRGVKLLCWSPLGMISTLLWTPHADTIPQSGEAYIVNCVVRNSLCPQQLYECQADLTVTSRLIICGPPQTMPPFVTRLDARQGATADELNPIPQNAMPGMVVHIPHAMFIRITEREYMDKSTQATKKMYNTEIKIGCNPNLQKCTIWDGRLLDGVALNSPVTIVALKIVQLSLRNTLEYNSTAITVIRSIGGGTCATPARTAASHRPREELEPIMGLVQLTTPPKKQRLESAGVTDSDTE